MRKHSSLVLVVVFVASLVAIGVLYLPRLFASAPQEVVEMETVIPGHWWKLQLNEQKIEEFEGLWQSEISTKQLLEELWPEVLQEVPVEAVSAWEGCTVYWPSTTVEVWNEYPNMHYAKVVLHEDMRMHFEIYAGNRELETGSFDRNITFEVSEDQCYRISLYTD